MRIVLSGVNPGDTKKRSAWTGGPLPYPRIVPHSDGAGVIEAVGGTIAAYGTHDPHPRLDFRPMLFDNVTLRLLGSDDFPVDATRDAAVELTAAAAAGDLTIPIAEVLPLEDIAAAHDLVDRGIRGRILVSIP